MRNLLLLLFALPTFLFAQRSVITLLSHDRTEMGWNKPAKKVNIPLSLTYSTDYSLINFGDKTVSFHNDMYRQDNEGDEFVESIKCSDGDGFNEGYYQIRIGHSKTGVNFQIALTNGFTYYVGKAEVYSEDGKVTANVYIKNVQNLKKAQALDSTKRIERKRYSDSAAKSRENNGWAQFWRPEDSTSQLQRSIIAALSSTNAANYDYHFFKKKFGTNGSYYVAVKNKIGDWSLYLVNPATREVTGPHTGEFSDIYPSIIE